MTDEVNVAVVEITGDGYSTLLWTDTFRLFDEANMYPSGWAMRFELLPWPRGYYKGSTRKGAIQELFLKNESHQIEGCEIYLRGSDVVPAPVDFNVGLDVLVTRAGASLATISEYLTTVGWATTVATQGSIQLQKSSVNIVAAAFLLLLGIAPGILYLLVKQGRPNILNVRLKSLGHEYEIVRLSHQGTSVEEVMAIVPDVQKRFSP